MRFWGRWWLAVFLFALAPMMFFLSNNHSFWSLASNAVSVIAMLLLASVSVVLCACVLRLLERSRGSGAGGSANANDVRTVSDKCDVFKLIVISFAVLAVFPFYTLHSYGKLFPGVGVIAALAVLIILFRLFGFAFINVFLAVLVVISAFNISRLEWEDHRRGSLSSEQILPAPPALPRSFVLREKPNIYLFYLESYHDRDTIVSQYGFDAPALFAQMDNLGFTNYPAYYANYLVTIESAIALFSMRHHYGLFAKGMTDMHRTGFTVLADNNVFAVLKNNGYRINLLDENTNYVFRLNSDQIDYKHFPSSRDTFFGARSATLHINPYLQSPWDAVLPYLEPVVKYDVGSAAEVFLRRYPDGFGDQKSPEFFYIHFGARHIDDFDQFYPEGWTKDWDEIYKKKYLEAASVLGKCLDAIQKHDPDGLIVLIGDHGAWKFGRTAGLQEEDFKDGGKRINRMFREHGLEPETVGRHLVSVIGAIRWPGNVTSPARPARSLSHVTLFPFIFCTLSGIEFDEMSFERNLSLSPIHSDGEYYMIYAQDGKLMEEWVPVIPESFLDKP